MAVGHHECGATLSCALGNHELRGIGDELEAFFGVRPPIPGDDQFPVVGLSTTRNPRPARREN